MDIAVTDRLLSTTRAVRLKLDLDREVPTPVIEECLRLAIQAPTPGAEQTWRWLVVRDQEQRNRLGALFREVGDEYMERRRAAAGVTATGGGALRTMVSAQHLIDVIERVPAFIIPCVQGRPTGDNAVDSVLYGGIFPAVWNLQLALRSRGLGSTLTTYHLERETEAAGILGIPPGVTQVALLPVAYITVDDFRPAPRRPLSEVVFGDTWGAPLTHPA